MLLLSIKQAFRLILGKSRSASYYKQSASKDKSNSVPLRTIDGRLIGSDGKHITGSSKKRAADDDVSFSNVKLGVNDPFMRTTVRGRSESPSAGYASDEEILDEYRRSQLQNARQSDEERGHRGPRNGKQQELLERVKRSNSACFFSIGGRDLVVALSYVIV
ncbi:hypothetical protein VTK56DRAFT_6950 [Thermocarpiscus australiensis]